MKLDEIYDLWAQDSEMNTAAIDQEAVKIPQLHHKYYKVFSNERLSLRKLEADYKQLYLLKFDYYLGTLDKETLDERGWIPNRRSILKSDIPMHIDADQDIINLTLKIAYQKEKINLLESIIKNISERGYIVKNFIDWQRFTNGAV
jgi:hypothetical protein